MPPDLQAKVFDVTPPGSRKTILSTNIAETSVTVPGVKFVIDSGMVKEMSFQPSTGISSLNTVPCSRASANQRAGRAGRTGPGKCFRLFPKWSFWNDLPATTPPEIQRVALDSTILLLKGLGINDLLSFDFMDPPSADVVIKSLETLYSLSALSVNGELTRLGRRLAELPLDPKLGATIIAAEKYGCVDEILSIVALMSESSSLFIRPKDKALYADSARSRLSDPTGDMMSYLRIYNSWVESGYDPNWSQQNFVQQRTLTRARDVRDQLEKMAYERLEIEPSSSGTDYLPIQKALVSGFAAHACRLNRDGQSYQTVGRSGMQVWIHPSSALAKSDKKVKWMLYFELVRTSKEFARSCTEIDPLLLAEIAPHLHKKEDLEKLGVDKKMPKGPGRVGITA